jgi:membrane protein GlpM
VELFIKAIIGAIIVVAISLISQTRYYFIAGLIPLFPTFALIAHIIVGQNSAGDLRNTVLFGMLSLIPYFFYLLSMYILSYKFSLYINLIVSTFIWFIFALLIYLLWIKVK